MEWLGRAKITFTHAAKPIPLRQKNGVQTDLLKICQQVTPPCQLNPLLFNGHVQTWWTAAKQHGPPIYYRRKIFQADHKTYHGTFAVDFVDEPFHETDESLPPRTAYFSESEFEGMGSDDTRPQLVVMHGLSGGSHEIYLRHAIAPLVESGDWEVCVVNSRGCAKSTITSGVLYNARATWDIRQVVKWLKKKFPNRPLFGLGFSLGANMLTNYIAEEGDHCLLKAAVICSSPFNLDVANKAMKRSVLGREIYQRVMGTAMKDLVSTHRREIEEYTTLDFQRLQSVKYLWEFDREVQCPVWGYPTEDAYYRDASSTDSILAIKIPFLAIQAADDPIVSSEAVPYPEFSHNPYTVICTTSLGGHLCWFEVGGGRWYARPVTNFLNHMAFSIDLDGISQPNGTKLEEEEVERPSFDPMRRRLYVPIVDD